MSRWIAAAMTGLVLMAQPAGAAPRGPATSPEGNPVGPGAPAPAAAAPAPARPAPPPPPPQPTTVEGLVITARPAAPPIDTVSAFVAEVSAPTANGRLARWDRKICPGVVGLKAPYGQALIDRIAAVSAAVGLETGAPGCRPNMVIIATDDSQTLAKSIVDRNPAAFARWERGMSRGDKALGAFVETPTPVRWWHVTRTKTADGQSYTQGAAVRVRSASRLRATTRDDFDHVIILIDVKRVGVIRFEALADYITMIGLAQIEPDVDLTGVKSVIGLFADRDSGAEPARGLTEWDAAYLLGLYSANRDVVRGSRQERDIARRMLQQLGAPVTGTEPAE
jgi:hypothetical protein